MKVLRVIDTDRVRPLHVVLLCLLVVTVAGSCLLTSGPHARMEGSKDWQEESPLRAIVGVLNLGYTQTTAQGIEIKSLMFGIGAGLAAMACGLNMLGRSRVDEEVSLDDTIATGEPEEPAAADNPRPQITPLAAAQALMALYVLWSFTSAAWSTAPDMAIGGSVLLAVGVVWALALGRGLSRRIATAGGIVLLCVCVATAGLAIAYFGERNPTRRASYPIGNPLFLAACLIPGALLCVGFSWAAVRLAARRRRFLAVLPACAVAVFFVLWAGWLTGSRSGGIALGVGGLAVVFFAAPPKSRWFVAIGATLIVTIGLWSAWSRFTGPSDTGRDASLRVRHYAWSYAMDAMEDAKYLGRGQGSFTQFGDGYAVADVATDPQALEARIAHAHNEWLEVGADLGGIGLTLVLGSLALTFWSGMTAVGGLTQPFERWSLIALLASLLAIAFEECADVGLRIAGLPTVYYTVLGLVWALSRSPARQPGCAGRPPGALRRVLGACSIMAGALLLWASMGDFSAARAGYDVSRAIDAEEFDRAIALAESAGASRLSPQRRLAALEQLCSTYLYVARKHQSSGLDRWNKANTTDPPSPTLMQLAAGDRAQSERLIGRAKETLHALIRRSPEYYGSGWLEYRLNQLGTVYARFDGDTELAASKTADAGRALQRQLRRRPYDPIVAMSYVDVAGDRLSFGDAFAILAAPLRHAMITPDYAAFIGRISGAPGFDERFKAIWNALETSDSGVSPEDSFAPEKLRLAALIRKMRDDYARAFEPARRAHDLYDASVPAGTIGAAACLAEMADYRFSADPSQTDLAIADAERAVSMLPDSTPGRAVAAVIRAQLVTYDLASNNEVSARTRLAELYQNQPQSFLDAELGRQYAQLCRILIHRSRGGLPVEFENWVARAITLRPRDELAWRLSGQVAFDKGDFQRSVDCLRRALELGADPAAVYTFVQLALRLHWDSPPFQTLEDELRSLLIAGGVLPADAPPPAPLHRPDGAPESPAP